MIFDVILKHESNTVPGKGGFHNQIDIIEHKLSLRFNPDLFAIALKLPSV